MIQSIHSRFNLGVGDTLDDKWTILAKRTIAEPTPRTPFQGPRYGIYDYDVEPLVTDAPIRIPAKPSTLKPLMSFRKVRS